MGRLWALLGVESNTTSHREKLISGLGAFCGIGCVWFVSSALLGPAGSVLLLASMGASAVLLFAVPHGTLSQPWPVLGGHLLSAAVGVSCQWYLGQFFWAPALAVGMAVTGMCYFRCIHPPGGATALAAVIGGPEVHSLGFGYILVPVALNVAAIFIAAAVFNNLFYWRRYPVSLMRASKPAASAPSLTHEDFAAAMHSLDTYVDVSSEELAQIFDRAWAHAQEVRSHSLTLTKGCYYSNGELGDRWCVRQIFDADNNLSDDRARLIYRNVAGASDEQTVMCTVQAFRQWARFRVDHKNGRWVRVTDR